MRRLFSGLGNRSKGKWQFPQNHNVTEIERWWLAFLYRSRKSKLERADDTPLKRLVCLLACPVSFWASFLAAVETQNRRIHLKMPPSDRGFCWVPTRITLLSAVDFIHVREPLQGEEPTMRVAITSHLSKVTQSSNQGSCWGWQRKRKLLSWGTMLSDRTLQWDQVHTQPPTPVSTRDHQPAGLQKPLVRLLIGYLMSLMNMGQGEEIHLKALFPNVVKAQRKLWPGSSPTAPVNHSLSCFLIYIYFYLFGCMGS